MEQSAADQSEEGFAFNAEGDDDQSISRDIVGQP